MLGVCILNSPRLVVERGRGDLTCVRGIDTKCQPSHEPVVYSVAQQRVRHDRIDLVSFLGQDVIIRILRQLLRIRSIRGRLLDVRD